VGGNGKGMIQSAFSHVRTLIYHNEDGEETHIFLAKVLIKPSLVSSLRVFKQWQSISLTSQYVLFLAPGIFFYNEARPTASRRLRARRARRMLMTGKY
jgi:hypothetical protein